jgi:hypothetical protein
MGRCVRWHAMLACRKRHHRSMLPRRWRATLAFHKHHHCILSADVLCAVDLQRFCNAI